MIAIHAAGNYSANMKSFTVHVPEHLNARLESLAGIQRLSKSALVRNTLLKAIGKKPARSGSQSIHARLSRYQDAGATGVSDLASNPSHLAAYGRE